MRVTIYDKNPGKGFGQWSLKVLWLLTCWVQKLFGKVDAYYGASSWVDAISWLQAQKGPLSSIQFWCHGSPGGVYIAEEDLHPDWFKGLKSQLNENSLIWFRTCKTFQGRIGQRFSLYLANLLRCRVAGHTRTIGLFQGGLHTQLPFTAANWPESEGSTQDSWWPDHLRWDNVNTIFCLTTKIPDGW